MKNKWRLVAIISLVTLCVGCGKKTEDTTLVLNDTMLFEHIVSVEIEDKESGDLQAVKDEDGYIIANDTVYVLSGTLNLRQAPSSESELLTTVTYGTAMTRTGMGEEGWDRLVLDRKVVG